MKKQDIVALISRHCLKTTNTKKHGLVGSEISINTFADALLEELDFSSTPMQKLHKLMAEHDGVALHLRHLFENKQYDRICYITGIDVAYIHKPIVPKT